MDYPKVLTDKDWQKHKGILAKIIKESKKSGVGDALTDCENAFAAFKGRWTEVGGNRKEQLETWQDICNKEGKDLVNALQAAADLAGQKETEWGKKTSMVPKDTVKAVGNVATEAANFKTVVENYFDSYEQKINDDCDKADEIREKQMEALIGMFAKVVKQAYSDAKDALGAFQNAPTAETYNNAFSGGNGVGRRMATALRQIQMAKERGVDIDDPQELMDELNPWATGKLMNAPEDLKAMGTAVANFGLVLKAIKKAYPDLVK